MKNLLHIDSNFYKISTAQAKAICGGKLPKIGYEKEGDFDAFSAQFRLGKMIDDKFSEFPSWGKIPGSRVIVQRTPLRWWRGSDVKSGWVWAAHVFIPAT